MRALSVRSTCRFHVLSLGKIPRCKLLADLKQRRTFASIQRLLGVSRGRPRHTKNLDAQARLWLRSEQRVDRESPYLDTSDTDNAAYLREELAKTKADLAKLEQEVEDGTIFEPVLKDLPPEHQDLLRSAFKKENAKSAQEEEDIKSELTKVQLPDDGTMKTRRLNTAMEEYMRGAHKYNARSNLWKHYYSYRTFRQKTLALFGNDTWALLFTSTIASQSHGDAKWALRRVVIYEDMVATGKIPTTSQTLLYIDGLSNLNSHNKAINLWQEIRVPSEADPEMNDHWHIVGISALTRSGQMAEAEGLANRYLSQRPVEESRILFGIITGWLDCNSDSSDKAAWSTYESLKSRLGRNATPQDYDTASSIFMSRNRTEYAYTIYKEMTDRVKAQNRFFFGSWLKVLIGRHQIDGAIRVLQLMAAKNIDRDARHVNGIIGALLRSKKISDASKAADLAWAMVQRRLKFVVTRNRATIGEDGQTVRPPPVPTYLLPIDNTNVKNYRALVPRANVETFSLLAFHYVNRSMEPELEMVKQALADSEITPSVYYMNHLLFHELRRGNLSSLWTLYVEAYQGIEADGETLECLWSAEKIHLERGIFQPAEDFPGPRFVLREMAGWFCSLSPTKQREAKEYFTKQLYEKVLACMCLAKDFEGLIVACYFFAWTYNVYPDGETAKAVTLRLARMSQDLGLEGPAEWKPRRHNIKRDPIMKSSVTNLIKIHEMLWEERRQNLEDRGLLKSIDSEEAQTEEHLFVFKTFICSVIMRIKPDIESQAAMDAALRQVASEMSLGELDFGDPSDRREAKPTVPIRKLHATLH